VGGKYFSLSDDGLYAEMVGGLTTLIDPLIILIIFLASIAAPALLMRRVRRTLKLLPRHYCEEARDYLAGGLERPRETVETLLEALGGSGVMRSGGAFLWRQVLAGPLSSLVPDWVHRRLLLRLIRSAGGTG
jgi:hypothetical protein